MNISDIIKKVCFELEDINECIPFVKLIDTSHDLHLFLDHYNWDDGFVIPTLIANHPKCEMATAQKLYWLASADYWFESDEKVSEYNIEHYNFSKLISNRLLEGYYNLGTQSNLVTFNRVQCFKFKKQGFPEVFYTPVIGKNT